MKKLLILMLFMISFSITSIYASNLTLFTSEAVAQKHCPDDVIVWLNLPSGIWHPKGGRWYGNTKKGSYVCKKEALAAGDRGSLNGQ